MNLRKSMLEFKGRGLFVFSDPGGAKAVLAQAYALKNLLTECKIISDRQYPFFTDFGLPVIKSEEAAETVIGKMKPDFIFTGTSYTSKIELNYVKAARKENIATFSFVDHWTSFKERFDLNGEYIFPAKILVIDERAKNMAVHSGIEGSLVKIFGNPYYLYLEKWKPEVSKTELLQMLKIHKTDLPLIIFAPDPLSNINGLSSYGFDEVFAIKKINEILETGPSRYNFILKLHPNQNKDIIAAAIGSKINIADAGINSNLLIYYADLVIGFFSNFLIEASILKKKVLRYIPEYISNDPLAEAGVGKIVNTTELRNELNLLNGIK